MDINKDMIKNATISEIDCAMSTIITKVTESQEEFIFETITPFIMDNLKLKINKSELIEALLMYRTFKEKMEAYYCEKSNSNI